MLWPLEKWLLQTCYTFFRCQYKHKDLYHVILCGISNFLKKSYEFYYFFLWLNPWYHILNVLNPFMTEAVILKKPVHWFAEQERVKKKNNWKVVINQLVVCIISQRYLKIVFLGKFQSYMGPFLPMYQCGSRKRKDFQTNTKRFI